jgi:hypothetical protein
VLKALTLKVAVPTVVGVPEITPLLPSDNPPVAPLELIKP